MTPIDHTSTSALYFYPINISGAIYRGVPIAVDSTVELLIIWLTPKSIILTRLPPYLLTNIIFSGFKSL